jgi:hypothetical protein
MRLISSIAVSLVFAVLSADLAKAEDKAAVSVHTKTISASVSIDNELKAYPGLYDNLLAEGRKELAKWRADADKERRESSDSFAGGRKWTLERSYSQRSAVGRYVSITREDGTYTGGAHPNRHTDTILWDRVAKKPISIRPFFKETADNGPTMTALAKLARVAVARLKIDRNDNYGEKDKLDPEKFAAESSDLQTGIEPKLLKLGPVTLAPSTVADKSSGLTFHYSPYAVGAYAEGDYVAFVPWTDFKQFLSPEGLAIFAGERPGNDAEKF